MKGLKIVFSVLFIPLKFCQGRGGHFLHLESGFRLFALGSWKWDIKNKIYYKGFKIYKNKIY